MKHAFYVYERYFMKFFFAAFFFRTPQCILGIIGDLSRMILGKLFFRVMNRETNERWGVCLPKHVYDFYKISSDLSHASIVFEKMTTVEFGWFLAFCLEKKEEIWSCDKKPYTHIIIQQATWQHKNATKNFADTTIADRLRTVSSSNSSHPTGVVHEWGNNDTWNTRTRGTLLQRSTLQLGISVDNSNEVIMTLETSGRGEPCYNAPHCSWE